MSNNDWKAGRDWARQHPNVPAPPKANPDERAGVNHGRR